MGQHSSNFVIADGALEPRHIVFSVRNDLREFSVRSALDRRGAQIGHLQALANWRAAAVWPVAGLALGFIDSCASCIVRTGGRACHRDGNDQRGDGHPASTSRSFLCDVHSPPDIYNNQSDLRRPVA